MGWCLILLEGEIQVFEGFSDLFKCNNKNIVNVVISLEINHMVQQNHRIFPRFKDYSLQHEMVLIEATLTFMSSAIYRSLLIPLYNFLDILALFEQCVLFHS